MRRNDAKNQNISGKASGAESADSGYTPALKGYEGFEKVSVDLSALVSGRGDGLERVDVVIRCPDRSTALKVVEAIDSLFFDDGSEDEERDASDPGVGCRFPSGHKP